MTHNFALHFFVKYTFKELNLECAATQKFRTWMILTLKTVEKYMQCKRTILHLLKRQTSCDIFSIIFIVTFFPTMI